ncbi:amidohydrolase family protein [bacterium]|nr:amidohydrolase family protein [bacterium]
MWNNFEKFRYRFAFSRESPLEKPMERALSRILRGFPPETPKDLIRRMDEAGVSNSVVLAPPPVVSNEDVLAGCRENPRLIPFISPDPGYEPEDQIEALMAAGGRGIKIHPLLQDIKVWGEYSQKVAKLAAKYNVPLVFHAGGSSRLFGKKCMRRTSPKEFLLLARAVPNAKIVVGHVGLWEFPQILDFIKEAKNLYVDISFQSPWVIQKCVNTLGSSRILLGSDSPLGKVKLVLENIALAGLNKNQTRDILTLNPERLLNYNSQFTIRNS